jgi:hypothetical protein
MGYGRRPVNGERLQWWGWDSLLPGYSSMVRAVAYERPGEHASGAPFAVLNAAPKEVAPSRSSRSWGTTGDGRRRASQPLPERPPARLKVLEARPSGGGTRKPCKEHRRLGCPLRIGQPGRGVRASTSHYGDSGSGRGRYRPGTARLRPSHRCAEGPSEVRLDCARSVGRGARQPRTRSPALLGSPMLLYAERT